MVVSEVNVASWFHRHVIGKKGANIRQLAEEYPKVIRPLLNCIFFAFFMNTYQLNIVHHITVDFIYICSKLH